ncbi:hypothetical protein D3C72_2474260 [compost metagenome]
MAGFDLTCLASAVLFAWMSRKAARARRLPAKAPAKAPTQASTKAPAKASAKAAAAASPAQAAPNAAVYEPRGDTP